MGGTTFTVSGTIRAYSGSTEISFVSSENGTYEIFLPVGDIAVVPSVTFFDPNLIYPLPFEVTTTDTGSVVALTHDFVFDEVGPGTDSQQISGQVFSDGVGIEVDLEVRTTSGILIQTIQTDSSGFWAVNLAPGDYVISVDSVREICDAIVVLKPCLVYLSYPRSFSRQQKFRAQGHVFVIHDPLTYLTRATAVETGPVQLRQLPICRLPTGQIQRRVSIEKVERPQLEAVPQRRHHRPSQRVEHRVRVDAYEALDSRRWKRRSH